MPQYIAMQIGSSSGSVTFRKRGLMIKMPEMRMFDLIDLQPPFYPFFFSFFYPVVISFVSDAVFNPRVFTGRPGRPRKPGKYALVRMGVNHISFTPTTVITMR